MTIRQPDPSLTSIDRRSVAGSSTGERPASSTQPSYRHRRPFPIRIGLVRYGNASPGKFTWSAGMEWRPLDSLLVRGSYGTGFRAPDMHYLFAGDDYYTDTDSNVADFNAVSTTITPDK